MRTEVPKVRAELEADGYDIKALTTEQIKTVGITPANMFVTNNFGDSGLGQEQLALLERYIAGHLILQSGADELRQIDSESLTDGSSVDYAGDRAYTDFRSSSLGQKAIQFDTTGKLESMSKPNAGIEVPDVR